MSTIIWQGQRVSTPPRLKPPRASVVVPGEGLGEVVEVLHYEGDGWYQARVRLLNGEERVCRVNIDGKGGDA
jgi:hypothetical protein